MKEWIAKYQKAIVGTGAVSVLLICYLQQREMTQLRSGLKELRYLNGGDIAKAQYIDSLQNVNDSLRNYNIDLNTIIGRYELTLENLKKENPNAGKEFENFFYTQTE